MTWAKCTGSDEDVKWCSERPTLRQVLLRQVHCCQSSREDTISIDQAEEMEVTTSMFHYLDLKAHLPIRFEVQVVEHAARCHVRPTKLCGEQQTSHNLKGVATQNETFICYQEASRNQQRTGTLAQKKQTLPLSPPP